MHTDYSQQLRNLKHCESCEKLRDRLRGAEQFYIITINEKIISSPLLANEKLSSKGPSALFCSDLQPPNFSRNTKAFPS